jgi:hypothetical protein
MLCLIIIKNQTKSTYQIKLERTRRQTRRQTRRLTRRQTRRLTRRQTRRLS